MGNFYYFFRAKPINNGPIPACSQTVNEEGNSVGGGGGAGWKNALP